MFLGFHRSVQLDTQGFRYNIVPFQTIKMYITHFHSFNFSTWVINLFGNIGVFIPFGVMMPALLRKARRFFPFLRLFLTALIVLELLQMVTHVGSFDVDDLILNSLGAVIGYLLLGRKLG
jgi:glycopeptide antibiotics resistance protein